jgi:hypothetical protein
LAFVGGLGFGLCGDVDYPFSSGLASELIENCARRALFSSLFLREGMAFVNPSASRFRK